MWKYLVGLAALIVCASGRTRADELVVNGDFQAGDFSGWTLSGDPSPYINVVLAFRNERPGGSDGFYAELGPTGSDRHLSQDLATNVGDLLHVTFWLENEGGSTNDFTASLDGVTLLGLNDVDPFDYTEYTFDITATATTTSLQFDFRNDPSFWLLDGVSVQRTPAAVPEPASVVLAGLGLLCSTGYALWLRRATRTHRCVDPTS